MPEGDCRSRRYAASTLVTMEQFGFVFSCRRPSGNKEQWEFYLDLYRRPFQTRNPIKPVKARPPKTIAETGSGSGLPASIT